MRACERRVDTLYANVASFYLMLPTMLRNRMRKETLPLPNGSGSFRVRLLFDI